MTIVEGCLIEINATRYTEVENFVQLVLVPSHTIIEKILFLFLYHMDSLNILHIYYIENVFVIISGQVSNLVP